MSLWKKLSHEEIKSRVFNALKQNVNYYDESVIGLPASHLDDRVFYQDAPMLSNAPFLSTLIHNPNHIGCHTLGESESFFKGTQEIEKELIKLCAEEIMHGETDAQDGYVAAGGTEANMQAVWIYRNYFLTEKKAKPEEITILCSQDAHYSAAKAGNVLHLTVHNISTEDTARAITSSAVEETINRATKEGKKYFIVLANMMTTMHGSVDDTEAYTSVLKKKGLAFKMHIDAAYGGFYFPIIADSSLLDFRNPDVNSITLDAHKMLQAPYGTGIFLIRKKWIHYAGTKAGYVQGDDFTLIGSRSGANAIAVWMILMTYGPYAWFEKMNTLKQRTDWLEKQITSRSFKYYRYPQSNIISIGAKHIPQSIAQRFGVIPDNHHQPKWYKIVVMDHVSIDKLAAFLACI